MSVRELLSKEEKNRKKKKRNSHTVTSHNQSKYFHRREVHLVIFNRKTTTYLSTNNRLMMRGPYGYSHQPDHDETQPFNVDGGYQYSQSYQTDANNTIQSWEQLLGGDTVGQGEQLNQDVSSADFPANHTASFQFNKDSSYEEVNADVDYETIVRSKNAYNDPQPQIIRKPCQANPVVYNQKVIIRFLQPPPVEQGPLIIREVRPPQPPPQAPIVS